MHLNMYIIHIVKIGEFDLAAWHRCFHQKCLLIRHLGTLFQTVTTQGQPRQQTPTILTIQQPQGQVPTTTHHTVLRHSVPVNHTPIVSLHNSNVSTVSQTATATTTTVPGSVSVTQAGGVMPGELFLFWMQVEWFLIVCIVLFFWGFFWIFLTFQKYQRCSIFAFTDWFKQSTNFLCA